MTLVGLVKKQDLLSLQQSERQDASGNTTSLKGLHPSLPRIISDQRRCCDCSTRKPGRKEPMMDPGFRVCFANLPRHLLLPHELARAVPRGAASVKCEGHASDRFSLQSHQLSGHLKLHPLCRRGQRTNTPPTGCSFDAVGNKTCAPIGAMIPRSVIPLQHHLLWRVGRIEVNIRKETIALLHVERGCRPIE